MYVFNLYFHIITVTTAARSKLSVRGNTQRCAEVCIRIYLWAPYTHIYIYIHTYHVYICIHDKYMYIHVDVYSCIHVHTYIWICIYVYIIRMSHINNWLSTCDLFMYILIPKYIPEYIYTYIHIYNEYIHIWIYIYMCIIRMSNINSGHSTCTYMQRRAIVLCSLPPSALLKYMHTHTIYVHTYTYMYIYIRTYISILVMGKPIVCISTQHLAVICV